MGDRKSSDRHSHSVLVVGTGSIGRRHIDNLAKLGVNVSAFSYRVCADAGTAHLPGKVHVFNQLEEAFANAPDAVVIANRTELHMDVALAAAQLGQDLFIEKPLSNSLRGVGTLITLVESQALAVETGFMLRFHPNLRWIKSFLQQDGLGELHYVRAMVGQHLANWHPGTDHRRSYSAQRLGGGVIFDLVHELDLMAWLFGAITEVHAMTAFTPSLEIESESIAQIGLRFSPGLLGQVHLDYVRPIYGRSLEIVGSRGILTWEYPTGAVSVTLMDGSIRIANEVPKGYERNDLFIDHMRHFICRLSNRELAPASSLNDGIAALRVALACHLSGSEKRCVNPAEIRENFSTTEVPA